MTFQLDGRRTRLVERPGATEQDTTTDSPPPRVATPAFGRWQPLIEVDADNVESLAGAWETFDVDRWVTPPGGGMVAWSSGWGDGAYPTWTGRDASGAVTCFVADMLLFGRDG